MNFVHNAIIPDPNAPLASTTHQLLCAGWARVMGQGVNGSNEADGLIESSEGLGCSPVNLNAIDGQGSPPLGWLTRQLGLYGFIWDRNFPTPDTGARIGSQSDVDSFLDNL